MPTEPSPIPSSPDLARQQAKRRRLAAAAEENDIGEIPPVKDPDRRRTCEADPALWLRTYHPEHFFREFSASQREFIEIAWNAIQRRAYQNVNAYRSFGKTSILSGLMELALLSGRNRFGIYISAVDSMSVEAAAFFAGNFQQDVLTEEGEWTPASPLSQDYPEVCYPIARRAGVAQKPLEYHGRRCQIEIKPDRLRFPTVPGSVSNANLLLFTSIWSGNIRGKRHQIPTEGTFRPDLVMIDDVQSDGTSKSDVQVTAIMNTIKKSVEGLAGYNRATGRKDALTILSALTQNQPDDVAVRLADRPEYATRVYRFLKTTPDDFAPWREYRDFWSDTWNKYQRKEVVLPMLRDYYNTHRTEIEFGVEPDNPENYEEGQVGAIHFALDFWCKSETAFWCELQNDAKRAAEESGGFLTPIQIQRKTRKSFSRTDEEKPLRRYQVPLNTEILTAFLDCGEHYLNYQVTAFGKNYEFAHVVDFGVFPEQNYPVTKKSSYRVDIQDLYTSGDKFDRLGAAVIDCLWQIFEQCYLDADGKPYNVHQYTDYVQHAVAQGPVAPAGDDRLPASGGRKSWCDRGAGSQYSPTLAQGRVAFRRLAVCGVDCSDGEMEGAIWKAIDAFHRRENGKYFGRAIPCYGDEAQSRLMRYYDLKIGEWRRDRGSGISCDWIENPRRSVPLRNTYPNCYASLLYDANTAKSRREQAWMTAVERAGSETLFLWSESDYLRMFAEHQCAEEWIEGWKSNMRYRRWRMKKPRVSDNEFLDTDAGCWALSSYVGLDYQMNVSQTKRLRVKWSS